MWLFVQALCPHKEITRNQLMEYLINKQHIPLTLSLILTKRIYSPELEAKNKKSLNSIRDSVSLIRELKV